MICYRDRTFCPFWEDCADHDTCARPATDLVKARAEAMGLPLALFGERPDCHQPMASPLSTASDKD